MSESELSTAEALSQGLEALEGLYLTFSLAEEVYGLEILAVQEIIQLVPTTAIPKTPSYVRGVVNLRGKVIPVVDLRAKFGMDPVEDTGQTCIIVVQVAGAGRSTTMGVVVDRVAEVIEVSASQIEPPPSFGSAVDTDFLLGMGKVGDTVVMLLDIRRVLAAEELVSTVALAEA